MSFQDKDLQCADCGATFTFTSGEQEFFSTKGFTNEPRRCPSCRQVRKSESGGGGYSGGGGGDSYGAPRQMYPTICAECGTTTEVPFQPRGDKPVYCNDCFRKNRPDR